MNCTCEDREHDMTALWHRAFCRWFDHDRAGCGLPCGDGSLTGL